VAEGCSQPQTPAMPNLLFSEVLALLFSPPSLLPSDVALALLLVSQQCYREALKSAGLWHWYCSFVVDCNAIKPTPELANLWRKLLAALHGVKHARHAGTTTPCRWLLRSADDLCSALNALQTARKATSRPRELFMATLAGVPGSSYLKRLRRHWDVIGYRSNMATCWIGDGHIGRASMQTRAGDIDVRLLLEMRRIERRQGQPESLGICFAIVAVADAIGCCWDGTERMPRLFCMSATPGTQMFSLDVYRFSGKPGSGRRGSLTYTVAEHDICLRMGDMTDTTGAPLNAEVGATAEVREHSVGHLQDGPVPSAEPSVERREANGEGAREHEMASDSDVILEDPLESPAEITSDGSGADYQDEVNFVADAIGCFNQGHSINFLFVLHGESCPVLSPSCTASESGGDDEAARSDGTHESFGSCSSSSVEVHSEQMS